MEELIGKSLFFGVAVSVVGYEAGLWIKKGKKSVVQSSFYFHCICNGYVGHIPGRLWRLLRGGKYLSYLLTPATVCLAVPLYQQMELLKKTGRL